MINQKQRKKIFYGWWVIGVIVVILMYISGTISSGFTAFFVPIATTFGWSYAAVAIASSIRGAETGLLAPLVGFLFDRIGGRKLIFAGGIVVALGLFILSRTNSLTVYYISFVVIAIGTSACMGVVPMAMVTKWFRKRVSLASGIVSSGTGLGGLLIPLVTILIDRYDWRTTLLFISGGAIAIILPLSFVIRNKPEDVGTLPDGEQRVNATIQNQEEIKKRQENSEVMPVIKSAIFWFSVIAFALHVMVTTAVITHIMPYLQTIGISRTSAGLMASVIPFMTIFGRLGFGWLGDKFDIRKLTAVGLALTGIGLVFLVLAGSYNKAFLIVFFITFGIGFGGPVPLQPAFIRQYFPKGRFGTIFGLAMGISCLTMLIGAPLAGWVYDNYGTYQIIWYAYGATMIAALIFILVIPPLRKIEKTPLIKQI